VEELPLQDAFAPLVEAQGRIMLAEGVASMAWERATFGHELSRGLLDLLEQGDRVTAEAYRAAQHTAEVARARHAELPYDALLVPAAVGEAPAGIHATGDPVFNRPWTLLGGPCLSVPAGSGPHGLPVGVQLVGRRWEDAELLAVASWAADALSLRCNAPARA
jgi:Asp-tRNA(Asn)/Glu-tRNA(Gln) amidotransferase A subunit family amidase